MTNAFRCVVDASVAIKQFIRDPLSEKTIELFALLVEPETEFLVPDLFYIRHLQKFVSQSQQGRQAD
jgi:hypothetical protein